MPINRLWTEEEAGRVKSALPSDLKQLVDLLPTLKHTCHDCEYCSHGFCKVADKIIPASRLRESFDCYRPREMDPF